jgi:hypothetical protein
LCLFLVMPACTLLPFNVKVFWDIGLVWNIEAKSVRGETPLAHAIKFLKGSQSAEVKTVCFKLCEWRETVQNPDFRLADRGEDIAAAKRWESEQPRDAPSWSSGVSKACREDFRRCQGVRWYPFWSPLILWGLTLGAWLSTALCLVMIVFGFDVWSWVKRAFWSWVERAFGSNQSQA